MTAIRIRPSTIDDVAEIERVLAASYGSLWQGHYGDDDLVRMLPFVTKAQPRLVRSGRFFVAFDGNRMAGCGGWSHETPGDPDRVTPGLGHVRHVAVDPGHLRKGVGAALFDACRTMALAEGVVRMEALSSLQAVPFYASLGFVAGDRVDVTIAGAALASVRMTRDPL